MYFKIAEYMEPKVMYAKGNWRLERGWVFFEVCMQKKISLCGHSRLCFKIPRFFPRCFPLHKSLSWLNSHGADRCLALLHSERPKLHRVLAFLSATGLRKDYAPPRSKEQSFFIENNPQGWEINPSVYGSAFLKNISFPLVVNKYIFWRSHSFNFFILTFQGLSKFPWPLTNFLTFPWHFWGFFSWPSFKFHMIYFSLGRPRWIFISTCYPGHMTHLFISLELVKDDYIRKVFK